MTLKACASCQVLYDEQHEKVCWLCGSSTTVWPNEVGPHLGSRTSPADLPTDLGWTERDLDLMTGSPTP